MARTIVLALVVLGLAAAPLAAGAEAGKDERPREVPHYESPILSLLLLPVNLLIRMTSIVSPDAERPARERTRGE